jgi:hypothetical protein
VALPAYKGSGTFTSGTGTIVPPMPTAGAAPAANDILLLVCESENQAITLSSAQGFVEVTNSPQGTGTAGTAGSTRLSVFWKRAVGSDVAPTVADSGDHTTGQIHCFSGVKTSGNPWNITAGGVDTTSDTSGSIPGATTTVNDCLVVLLCSSSADTLSTAQFGSWANADLGTVTERTDNTVAAAGLGGGHGMATGTLAVAGAYTSSSVTLATASLKGMMSVALESANPSTRVFPGLGAPAYAGLAATILVTVNLAIGLGAPVFTGLAPTVVATNNQTISAGLGAPVFSGFSPAVVVGNNQKVQPGTGAPVLAGLAPTILVTVKLPVGLGQPVFAGLAPTVAVSDNKLLAPGLEQPVFAGFAPSVVASISAEPGVGSATFAGFVPSAVLSDNQIALPGLGQPSFAGFAPVAAVGPGAGPINVATGVGAGLFTGFVPTVLGSLYRVENVHAGTCVLPVSHGASLDLPRKTGESVTDRYTAALDSETETTASDFLDASMSPGWTYS